MWQGIASNCDLVMRQKNGRLCNPMCLLDGVFMTNYDASMSSISEVACGCKKKKKSGIWHSFSKSDKVHYIH